MKLTSNSPCPCGSGNKYKKCCQPFHKGKLPTNALLLMKSRFSAYAYKEINYIIKTTHPDNSEFKKNLSIWRSEILDFCNNTEFKKLTILEFIDGENEAFVEFNADLHVEGKDSGFTEKSRFLKINEKWLYYNGIIN